MRHQYIMHERLAAQIPFYSPCVTLSYGLGFRIGRFGFSGLGSVRRAQIAMAMLHTICRHAAVSGQSPIEA